MYQKRKERSLSLLLKKFMIANDISGVGRISSNKYTLIPFAEKILAEISARVHSPDT